jgi:hypothetical protein
MPENPSISEALVNNSQHIQMFTVGVVSSRPILKVEGHPLSAVRDCLFNIFAATLHIWRPSPATRGRAMPLWQGTHFPQTQKIGVAISVRYFPMVNFMIYMYMYVYKWILNHEKDAWMFMYFYTQRHSNPCRYGHFFYRLVMQVA